MGNPQQIDFPHGSSPSFSLKPGQWAVIWMNGRPVEVPSTVQNFQVPIEVSDYEVESVVQKLEEAAATFYPGVRNVRVIKSLVAGPQSFGSRRWALHADGLRPHP